MEFPEDVKYTAQHEWVRREESGARVGITDFAQDALGDVVYVDVPQVGAQVTAGQAFGEVESTKSVSDIYAPVTGTILARNELLGDKPELVNEAPYGEGWMILIDPADPAAIDALMDASAYRELVEKESGTG